MSKSIKTYFLKKTNPTSMLIFKGKYIKTLMKFKLSIWCAHPQFSSVSHTFSTTCKSYDVIRGSEVGMSSNTWVYTFIHCLFPPMTCCSHHLPFPSLYESTAGLIFPSWTSPWRAPHCSADSRSWSEVLETKVENIQGPDHGCLKK